VPGHDIDRQRPGGITVNQLHGLLGGLVVAVAIGAAILAGVASVSIERDRGRRVGRLADLLAIVLAVLVLAAIVVGGLLLITGVRPSSPIHVLLALVALAAMPVAGGLGYWLDRDAVRGPARYRWLAGGATATVALGLLLALTG
jgi:hypothetical protein